MCPFMYLQVLTSSEHFTTAWKRTMKRFFPRVHPNMVHQLILRFKRSTIPRTVLPVARVVGNFRPADVLYAQVTNDFRHRREMFPANFLRGRLVGVYPQALHFLLDRSHVFEEAAVDVAGMMRHRHGVVVDVLVVRLGVIRRVVISP